MPLKRGCMQLVADARARIKTISVAEAQEMLGKPGIQFVDIRDVRELEREGMIPGAFNAPRGMLEFWVDPESPYYKDVFHEGKTYVLYCKSSWRSALATAALEDMGLTPVCHIDGGFTAWQAAGAPVAAREHKHA